MYCLVFPALSLPPHKKRICWLLSVCFQLLNFSLENLLVTMKILCKPFTFGVISFFTVPFSYGYPYTFLSNNVQI